MKFFVYGTLMKDYGNHIFISSGPHKYLGKAILPRYKRLNLTQIRKGNSNDKVEGELYDLSDVQKVKDMASFERYFGYTPMLVKVRTKTKEGEIEKQLCWCFLEEGI